MEVMIDSENDNERGRTVAARSVVCCGAGSLAHSSRQPLAHRQQLSHLLQSVRHSAQSRIQSLLRFVQGNSVQAQTTTLGGSPHGPAENSRATLHLGRVRVELAPQLPTVRSQCRTQRPTCRHKRLTGRAHRTAQTRAA